MKEFIRLDILDKGGVSNLLFSESQLSTPTVGYLGICIIKNCFLTKENDWLPELTAKPLLRELRKYEFEP